MGLSVPAVESLIHRAKQSLQKKLLLYFKNNQ
jgi:DNA-directed RNA polymerase specialized sigma24 family protein